jgi:Tfp pilus assembly protein PilX
MKSMISIRRGEGILRNQKGIVLPIALIFLVILSIMGIAAIMTSTSTTAVFGGLRRADEALYYAEAGVEAAKRLIAQTSPNFDTVYADNGRLHLPDEDGNGRVSYGNGYYSVVLLNNEDDPGYPAHNGDPNIERDGRYVIHSTGVASDASKTLEVVVESFSRFFYFTEWEEAPGTAGDPDIPDRYVFFRTGDNLDGPVHSNHAIHISGNPTFSALTSSNESPYKLAGSAGDGSIFLGATNWSRLVQLRLGPNGTFGDVSDLDGVWLGANAMGRIYDTYDTGTSSAWEYRVHFRGDQGMEADIYKKDPATQNWTLVETLEIGGDFNGVIYFHNGGPVHVGGKIRTTGGASQIGKLDATGGVESTVKGRWTICSARNPDPDHPDIVSPPGEMRIVGDIKYDGNYTAGGPFPTDPTGLLGLVSANNVVIKEDGEDTAQTIRNNGVTIHASIMAASNDNATFSVETALLEGVDGSLGRQINLLGGIIQYRRGVVGRFNMGGLTQGFQKNYRYDPRLYYMAPPSFPLALNLKMKSWRE